MSKERKLVLSQQESDELRVNGVVYVERGGKSILVERNPIAVYDSLDYIITIINPYERVVVKEVSK